MQWVALRFRELFFIAVALVVVFPVSRVSAVNNEPTKLTIPSTTLAITGVAAPNALVTILDDSSAVATTVADANGAFSTTIPVAAGLHNIDVYFEDVQGVQSKTFSQTVSAQPQQNTSVSVFLSPTLSLSSQNVVQSGSIIQVRGYTAPGAQVALQLDFGTTLQTGIADASGFYEMTFDTTGLHIGPHSLTVVATVGSQTSEVSNVASFELQTASGPATPDIIVSPERIPPPVPLSPQNGATINNDQVVVSGESLPGAQINIYQDGVVIGSAFVDENGQWSFLYTADNSRVILSFEACIDGQCSVRSRGLTLNFDGLSACDIDFHLDTYRFWDVTVGDRIAIDVALSSGSGVLEIDWGNGVVELLDHDDTHPEPLFRIYDQKGSFDGRVRFIQGDCDMLRHFSVHVTNDRYPPVWWSFWPLSVIAAGAGTYWFATKSNSPSKKRKRSRRK